MRVAALPSLRQINTAQSGSNFSTGPSSMKIHALFDAESLGFNADNSSDPALALNSTGMDFQGGNFYFDGVKFDGYSKVSIGGNSKFKRLVSNQITASIDSSMITSREGVDITFNSGQFLIGDKPKPSAGSSGAVSGYVDVNTWNNNTTKTFTVSDYQERLFFDLNMDIINNGSFRQNQPNNAPTEGVTINLPELYEVGNTLNITFWFEGHVDNKPDSFDITFSDQNTNSVQIISQILGENVDSLKFESSLVDFVNLDPSIDYELLYLGQNFLNINIDEPYFTGASDYQEKTITQDNNFAQWLLIDL